MIIEGMHYNENCECESCTTVSKKPKQIGSMTNEKIHEKTCASLMLTWGASPKNPCTCNGNGEAVIASLQDNPTDK